MPRVVIAHTTSSITPNNATPAAPTTVFGSGVQWSDYSDSSGAIIQGVYQTGVGIPGKGTADLETGLNVTRNPKTIVSARLRMGAGAGVGKPLPQVIVRRPNGDGLLFGGDSGSSPGGPVWVEIPLTEGVPGTSLDLFLYYLSTGLEAFTVDVAAPISFTYPSGATTYDWTVYEVEIVVTAPSADAPPCRLFPRSDGLGVGSGRNYPPPKSQQRSSRGVGYY